MNMASGLAWSNGELVQQRIFVYAPCTRHGFLWKNSLLDKGTSGVDNETQKCLENSIVYYVKMNGMAVLWVVHNEDIAERLLAP
jgi:ABC-type iron transport system FetAB ATPase subunit